MLVGYLHVDIKYLGTNNIYIYCVQVHTASKHLDRIVDGILQVCIMHRHALSI